MDQAILRVFGFRPVRGAFDELLRTSVVPELVRMPGLLDVYSGRQGPDDVGHRVVATVWESMTAMAEAVGEELGVFHPELLEETVDRELTLVRVLAGHRYVIDERPRLLRLVRGSVRPGELDAYTRDVREGTDADARRDNGPVSLYMGGVVGGDPDRFVTLSTWRDWPDIEAATGGDVTRPRITRRPEHLATWDVAHYEIVPGP